jgi:hypothetical protein
MGSQKGINVGFKRVYLPYSLMRWLLRSLITLILIARTKLSEKNELRPKFFIDENPPTNKNHWTYRMFFDNKDPSNDSKDLDASKYAKLQMNPIDNLDNISKDYIEELEQLPEREKKRFLLGEFGEGVKRRVL